MVTGDAPATPSIVAHAVGLDGAICPPGPIPDGVRPERHRGLDRHRRRQIGRRHGADEPDLAGIVAAVKEGRVIFQRILTYTLNSIIKKIVTVLLLVLGLIMTGYTILTALQDSHRRGRGERRPVGRDKPACERARCFRGVQGGSNLRASAPIRGSTAS